MTMTKRELDMLRKTFGYLPGEQRPATPDGSTGPETPPVSQGEGK